MATAEEVRQRYLDTMGVALGAFFHRLYNECAWLHLKWNDYLRMFGTKQSRVDLVNNAAPGVFRILQDALLDDILLHICRLTDEAEVGRRKRPTLSVRRIPHLVAPAIKRDTARLVTDVLRASSFARDLRNRRIAHSDLSLALDEGAAPLPEASRKGIAEAIRAIDTLLNSIENHYTRTTVAFELVSSIGNAEALLMVIRDGLVARAQRYERLKAGQVLPGDVEWQRPI